MTLTRFSFFFRNSCCIDDGLAWLFRPGFCGLTWLTMEDAFYFVGVLLASDCLIFACMSILFFLYK